MKKLVGLMVFVLVFGGLVGGVAADDPVEVDPDEWKVDLVAGESFERDFTVTWEGEEEGFAIIETEITYEEDDEEKVAEEGFDIGYNITGEEYSDNTAVMEPGEEREVDMDVNVSPAVKPAIYTFNTTVEVETDEHGVEVLAPDDVEVTTPGPHEYDFIVRNRGASNDTYDLGVEDTEDWNVSVEETVTVEGWSQEEVTVEVMIPGGEDFGTTSEITLTAESQNNETVYDNDSMEVSYMSPPETTPGETRGPPEIEVIELVAEILDEVLPAQARINYTVRNDGGRRGQGEFPLMIDGQQIHSETHDLDREEEETVGVFHTFDEPGTYTVTVGDQETEITVPEPEVLDEVVQEAEDIISEAEETIGEGEAGFGTLQQAVQAFEDEDYDEAINLASQALEEHEAVEEPEPPVEAPGITGRIIESPGVFIFGVISVVLLFVYGGYTLIEK